MVVHFNQWGGSDTKTFLRILPGNSWGIIVSDTISRWKVLWASQISFHNEETRWSPSLPGDTLYVVSSTMQCKLLLLLGIYHMLFYQIIIWQHPCKFHYSLLGVLELWFLRDSTSSLDSIFVCMSSILFQANRAIGRIWDSFSKVQKWCLKSQNKSQRTSSCSLETKSHCQRKLLSVSPLGCCAYLSAR